MAERHQLPGMENHPERQRTQPIPQEYNSHGIPQPPQQIPIEYFSYSSMPETSAAERDNKEVYRSDCVPFSQAPEVVVVDDTGLIPMEASDLMVVPNYHSAPIPLKSSDLEVVVVSDKSPALSLGWAEARTTTTETDTESKAPPPQTRRRFPFNVGRKTLAILIIISILLIIGACTAGVLVSQRQKRADTSTTTNKTENPERPQNQPDAGGGNSSNPLIPGRFGTTMHRVDTNGDGNVANYLYLFRFQPGSSKTLQFSWARVDEPNSKLENSTLNIGYQPLTYPTVPNSPIAVVGQPMTEAKDLIVDIFYLHQSEKSSGIVDLVQLRIFCAPMEPCRNGFNNILFLSGLGESYTVDPNNPSITASLINSESGAGVRKSLWLHYRTVKNEMVGHIIRTEKSGDKFANPNLKLFFSQALPQEELKETFNSAPAAFVGLRPSLGHFLFFGSRSGVYLVWWNESSHLNNFGTAPASGFRDDLPSRPEVYSLTSCSDPVSGGFYLMYADVNGGNISGFHGAAPMKDLGLEGNLSSNQSRKTQWNAVGTEMATNINKPIDAGREALSIGCYGFGNAILVYLNNGTLVYTMRIGGTWTETRPLGLDQR
ncbi:hypothetical protein QBC44DRAFT_372577 [Cladorrhinum sp. PSN332]|nr:hypothetical protein QBC44DRAFT_372577 [Cladorrhinum sp. PSN332]